MPCNLKPSWLGRMGRIAGAPARGRRRTSRPALESLEGRQLLTLIPLKGPDGTTAPPVEIAPGGDQNTIAMTQSIGEADSGNYAVASIQSSSVVAQLFTHSGAARTAPMNLGVSSGALSIPDDGYNIPDSCARLAMNREGDFVVAWTSAYTRFGRTNEEILAQVFNADGTPRGGVRDVAWSNDVEYQPSVGIDAAGDFVVAYSDWNGSMSHVYAAVCGNDGSETTVSLDGTPVPSSVPARVTGLAASASLGNLPSKAPNPFAVVNNHQPGVAMNESGAFVVAYTEDFAFGWQSVVARRYDATATPQGGLFTVDATLGSDLQPSVALNSSGEFVVAYTENDNPQRTLGDEQAAMGETVDTNNCYLVRRGTIFVPCYNSGSDILAAVYAADGTLQQTTPVAITSANEFDPSAAIDDAGRITIAYTSGGDSIDGFADQEIQQAYLRTFDAQGQPAPGEIPVALTPLQAGTVGNRMPSVAINGSGDVVAAYNHWDDNSGPGGLGGTHAYVQAFQTNPYRIVPDWSGVSPDTGIQLTNGQSFSLPVTIYRDPDYTGDVTLEGLDLPAGVTAVMSAPDPSMPLVEQRTLTFTAATDVAADSTTAALVASFGDNLSTPDVTVPIQIHVTAARIDSVWADGAPDGTLLKGNWAYISGAGLVDGSQVFFGSSATPAQTDFIAGDGTRLMALLPPDATDGVVTIVTPYGATITSPTSYTLSEGSINDLSITEGLAPQNLQQGSEVVLYGMNFSTSDEIQFGGDPTIPMAELQAQPFDVSPDGTECHVYVPRDGLAGVITDFKPDGGHFSSPQIFTVDSYRNTDGFSVPDDFSYNTSLDNVNDLFQPNLIQEPAALGMLAWAAQHGVGNDGACFGLALASLRYQEHTDWLTRPDGSLGTVNAVTDTDTLTNFIEAEELAQFSEQYLNAKSDYEGQHLDATGVYDSLVAMLQAGDHPLVGLYNTDGSGHCVVAYDVSGDPANGFTIYVYDPNRPYVATEDTHPALHIQNEDESVIHVEPDNTWTFFGHFDVDQTWANTLDRLTLVSASTIPDTPSIPDLTDIILDDIVGKGTAATTHVAPTGVAPTSVAPTPIAPTSAIAALPASSPTPKPAPTASARPPQVVRVSFRTPIAQVAAARTPTIIGLVPDSDGADGSPATIGRRDRHA